MRVAFLNPQGNFDPADSYWAGHPDFGGQLVYVKEVGLALAELGVQVDIVTRRIRDPEWPEFSGDVDYYEGFPDNPRILRITCGGDSFLKKEALWPCLSEFVDNLLEFYGSDSPDFVTSHYADAGYCAALVQHRKGIGFSFTGHSLGAQKIDKLGVNPENAAHMEKTFRFSKRIHAERLSMERASTIVTSTGQERFEQYTHPLYAGAVDVTVDAPVRGSGHGRKHRREPCVPTEDLDDQDPLVGPRRRAQPMGQLNGSGHAGAEADAVVGARDVVVHGLGNGHHLHPFPVEVVRIRQGVVTPDGDEVVHTQEVQVLQDVRREVVGLVLVLVLQVFRHKGLRQMARRVRDVCRNVPPVRPARWTISEVISSTQAELSASLSRTRSTRPRHPRRIPSTR